MFRYKDTFILILIKKTNYIFKAIDVSENLSKYWSFGFCIIKNFLQKTMFPKGLVNKPENRAYRTKNTSSLFNIINRYSGDSSKINKEFILGNI